MIVCADDYGLREDINSAILELCVAGKLSAVSCMVALESCEAACLRQLLTCGANIDVGLHLCLTHEDLAWSRMPPDLQPSDSFGSLLRRSLTGRLKPETVARQVETQYNLFLTKCGRPPDFMDGHLHTHQLPGALAGLLRFVMGLPAANRPYVRNTALAMRESWRHGLPWTKAALIGVFGNQSRKKLRKAAVPTNCGFAGIYDFRRWRKFPDYLPRFVRSLPPPDGLLVVHPGRDEDWRRQELNVLRSFTFPESTPNRFPSAR